MAELVITGTTAVPVIAGGFIRIAVNNPPESAAEPNVIHNDVYRRTTGDAEWIRISKGIAVNGRYDDYGAASGVTYDYKVRAIGENGAYSESAVSAAALTLHGVWLHDPADVSSVHHFDFHDEGTRHPRSHEAALLSYAGRSKPVVEFGEGDDEDVSVDLQLHRDTSDEAALEELYARRTTLLYRDARGRKVYGVLLGLDETDHIWGGRVPLTVKATDFSEAV